jgi:hypothetical protein
MSTNNGVNWSSVGLSNRTIYDFSLIGSDLVAGTDSGIYMSTNNGESWLDKNQGFGFAPKIESFEIESGFIFAGTGGQSVWKRSFPHSSPLHFH